MKVHAKNPKKQNKIQIVLYIYYPLRFSSKFKSVLSFTFVVKKKITQTYLKMYLPHKYKLKSLFFKTFKTICIFLRYFP